MKIFYLAGSIIFTVLILLIAFGNVGAQCQLLNFLGMSISKTSPILIILTVSIIGIVTGAMYHAFIVRVLDTGDDESDDF